ncbi:ribonuclease H family protein [Limosilactobacillus antri]|uniref:ribonuclease H family protein n=1 Tax=Limosilactobacillus antri TaxID=227943 RepID=UPI001F56EA06|nr:ribonuclease H family protein [Limosilactobacillus antri]
MTKKYYAVKKGRQPGIYTSWPACQQMVSGFPGAVYRSFANRAEAVSWLRSNQLPQHSNEQLQLNLAEQSFTQQPAGAADHAAILLYTDGGSRNHGNRRGQHVKSNDKAAWAYLIERRGQQYTGTDGEYGATNNKMELTALLTALQTISAHGWQDEAISATLDSHYVLDPITKGWLYGWQRRGWKTAAGKPVANKELWQELRKILPQFPHLHFAWTKGHAANLGNNTVDELLNTTMDTMGE